MWEQVEVKSLAGNGRVQQARRCASDVFFFLWATLNKAGQLSSSKCFVFPPVKQINVFRKRVLIWHNVLPPSNSPPGWSRSPLCNCILQICVAYLGETRAKQQDNICRNFLQNCSLSLCMHTVLCTLSIDQQRLVAAAAVKLKPSSSVTLGFAYAAFSLLVLLCAFLLLADRSDAYLSRWWVILTITKDGSKRKKQPPLTFQRYSSQVHCIGVEKCYCMHTALFGKVHKFSVTQGLTALIQDI